MEKNFAQLSRFLERTRQKESTSSPPPKRLSRPIRKLGRSVFAFLAGPALTIAILWILELAQIEVSDAASWNAFKSVLASPDLIFLVFSLAFTVILEWLISSDDNLETPFLLITEIILGMLSLILFSAEDMVTTTSTPDSQPQVSKALMAYKAEFHIILLLTVIGVAILGYFRRCLASKNSNLKRN